MERMARLATGKDYHNAARKLHAFLHREGKTLPVQISSAKIPIRRLKKGGGETEVQYPILLLSSWVSYILGATGGQFLLGGWSVHDVEEYTSMFARFWARYYSFDKAHPVFTQKTADERKFTVPICIHGDEGRGVGKLPVMIESYQPVIPWSGENDLNLLKYPGLEHPVAKKFTSI